MVVVVVGQAGDVEVEDKTGGLERYVGASVMLLLAWLCVTLGISVLELVRHKESATLVDRLSESLIAEMRESDSLMLAVRGR